MWKKPAFIDLRLGLEVTNEHEDGPGNVKRCPRERRAGRLAVRNVQRHFQTGFPQWNCNCANCQGLRDGTIQASARTQSSIIVSDNNRRRRRNRGL
jgi:coenzyme PQQ precursor peptide PqqA